MALRDIARDGRGLQHGLAASRSGRRSASCARSGGSRGPWSRGRRRPSRTRAPEGLSSVESATSAPSAPRWCILARRARIAGVMRKAVLSMPSGPSRWSCIYGAELLAADRLDHLAGPVDADAVLPALAGIEQQRRAQRCTGRSMTPGTPIACLVRDDVGVPDLVAEAGSVREQVAQRDRLAGLARPAACRRRRSLRAPGPRPGRGPPAWPAHRARAGRARPAASRRRR